jgi:Flp pilus assembly protein CpaB
MEAVQKRHSLDGAKRFLSTRKGAAVAAGITALLAAVVLVIFLQQYKSSVTSGVETQTVLRANQFIPKGTTGAIAISGPFLRPATLSSDQIDSGAVADASALQNKVATQNIYPGQQITAADFSANADPLRGQLSKNQRALAVPVDQAHGLIGDIRAGDQVDVFGGFNGNNGTGRGIPILRTLAQGVQVLKIDGSQGGGSASNSTAGTQNSSIVVRVTDQQASDIAFASDNGKVWFALRAPLGATQSLPSTVTLASILASTPSIPVSGSSSKLGG